MKKNYNPNAIGRWYRFFIESDGNSCTVIQSDIKWARVEEVTIDGVSKLVLQLPNDYKIINSAIDVNTIPNSVADSCFGAIVARKSGNQGITLPNASSFDYMYVYLFCRR